MTSYARAHTGNKFIGSVDYVTLHILRVACNTKLPVVFALLLCEGMFPFVDNFDIGTYIHAPRAVSLLYA